MKFTGTKYNQSLRTTEIATLIRQEIKVAVKSGVLPKAKYSVRSAHFAGGSSIDIAIKAPSFAIMNPKRIELEARTLVFNGRPMRANRATPPRLPRRSRKSKGCSRVIISTTPIR